MTRRYARELALQTLYSIDVGKHGPAEALEQIFTERAGSDERTFVREFVYGTLEHAAQSDAVISPLLQGWTLERLPTIDRLILRMSVYEMLHVADTPYAVVLNEAVELAKKYSTEDSGRFINGVLAAAGKVTP